MMDMSQYVTTINHHYPSIFMVTSPHEWCLYLYEAPRPATRAAAFAMLNHCTGAMSK